MTNIPIFALYGEDQPDPGQDWLHWETIRARSSLHDFSIVPHRHEQFFQVLSLTHGTAQLQLETTSTLLAAPAIVVVPALSVHGYGFSPDVEGVVLTLMERDVRTLGVGLGDLPEQPLVLDGVDLGAVQDAIARLVEEADRQGPGHGTAMQALIGLLLVSLHRLRLARVAVTNAGTDRAARQAQAFRALVETGYRQSRSVGSYAQALGVSSTHLNRICRQVLGASALRVIERRIALEARRELVFSALSIQQIGDGLGYPDPAYFTRFCTKMLGMAPGAFRREARRKD